MPSLIHVPLMCLGKRHLVGVECPKGGLYSGFQLTLDPVVMCHVGSFHGEAPEKELCRKGRWGILVDTKLTMWQQHAHVAKGANGTRAH